MALDEGVASGVGGIGEKVSVGITGTLTEGADELHALIIIMHKIKAINLKEFFIK